MGATLGAETERKLAAALHGETWTLLDRRDRSPAEDARMLSVAHASLYHWLNVGTAIHQARGEYMIARVHCALGQGAEALRHAERCRSLTLEEAAQEAEDWDLAFAYEVLARAYACLGVREEFEEAWASAQTLGLGIAEAEDRAVFLSEFEKGPWFGLREEN